jgi:hypothetical protein
VFQSVFNVAFNPEFTDEVSELVSILTRSRNAQSALLKQIGLKIKWVAECHLRFETYRPVVVQVG